VRTTREAEPACMARRATDTFGRRLHPYGGISTRLCPFSCSERIILYNTCEPRTSLNFEKLTQSTCEIVLNEGDFQSPWQLNYFSLGPSKRNKSAMQAEGYVEDTFLLYGLLYGLRTTLPSLVHCPGTLRAFDMMLLTGKAAKPQRLQGIPQ
jgi:hypothetical protein